VNRGFSRSNGISDYATLNSTSAASATAQSQGGAMLEGIREGVQGVSRMIAAGLGDLAPVPVASSPSPASASRQKAARRRHSTQPSSSSVSTYATDTSDSTRLSQSSASSLGDESVLREEGEGHSEQMEAEVRDTSSKPDTSADTVCERKRNFRPSDSSFDVGSKGRPSPSSIASERTTKIHRRKSRDRASSPPPSAFTSESLVSSTITSPTANSTSMKHSPKTKRSSMNGLPPATSIPGLGSLTGVNSSGGQPVASWVDSVGKKWGEIQRGPTYVPFSFIFVGN
jgi:hypothetical protein